MQYFRLFKEEQMTRTIKAKLASPPTGRNDGSGVDHDVWVAWVDSEDNDVNVLHGTFPIPNDRFDDLLAPMSDTARADLYKALIIEFYGSFAEPFIGPSPPTGLSDLDALEDYLDAKDVYDMELASLTAEATTMATQATTWIEGLAAFEGWPFPFTLQVGD
jgi:hypothetical protein